MSERLVNVPLKLYREGSVRFYASDLDKLKEMGLDYTKAPVFYNPKMKLNRDLSILVFKALSLKTGADLMTASGVRALRLALEAGGEKIIANDRNYLSCYVVRLNANINDIKDKVRVKCEDARLLAEQLAVEGDRPEYLDLDPFGSPSPYIDSFLRAVRREGVLAITATDTPPLFGKYPIKLMRYYGVRGKKVPFFREFGIRALISFVLRVAGRLDLFVRPLLSYTTAHYIRVFFKVDFSPSKASRSITEDLGWIKLDKLRVTVHSEPVKDSMGPIWISRLSDPNLLDSLISMATGDAKDLLVKLRDEVDLPPYYYPLNLLASREKVQMPSVRWIIEELRGMGYKATRFHGDPVALKTDAPLDEVLRLIRLKRSS